MMATWSHTVSTQPQAADDALVVCCLSLRLLGIDALVDEVTELCGEEEARRWSRARATEYADRVLDALNLHLPAAELIVHVEDAEATEKVRVILSGDAHGRELELHDRVDAIRRRTWLLWWESLQLTMAALRHLEEPFVDAVPAPGVERAA
jgi:hypothetical protein